VREENGGGNLGCWLFFSWPAEKEKGGGSFGVGNEERKRECVLPNTLHFSP